VLRQCTGHCRRLAGDTLGKRRRTSACAAYHQSDNGALKATLDSVDQNANGIPVSSISLKDSKLSLSVDAVHGSYEGKVAADGNTISGTWSQGQPLALDFKRATAPVKTEHEPAKPSDIDGTWMGSLDTGTIKLRIVLHIVNTEDGLTATLDSPDQGAKGLPVTSVKRDGAALKMEAKQLGGVFEGKIAADRSLIEGTWTQGGANLPLVLKPVKDQSELERKRPQNPTKPYPYREEEVSYENKVQNVTLAATLTLPQGKGPFPGVLLITGSGPQDRNESLLGHKPFSRPFRLSDAQGDCRTARGRSGHGQVHRELRNRHHGGLCYRRRGWNCLFEDAFRDRSAQDWPDRPQRRRDHCAHGGGAQSGCCLHCDDGGLRRSRRSDSACAIAGD